VLPIMGPPVAVLPSLPDIPQELALPGHLDIPSQAIHAPPASPPIDTCMLNQQLDDVRISPSLVASTDDIVQESHRKCSERIRRRPKYLDEFVTE